MKTAQPKSVPVPNTAGYPQTDIDRRGTFVKGEFRPGVDAGPAGHGQKERMQMRGAGAATKGTKFLVK
jgi:hypothetical protein